MHSVVLTFITVLILPILLIVVSYMVSPKTRLTSPGCSPFECGFDPSSPSPHLSLRFFVLMIIFLVFDLEITLILPLFSGASGLLPAWLDLLSMIVLVLLLTTIIEWQTGSLEWNL